MSIYEAVKTVERASLMRYISFAIVRCMSAKHFLICTGYSLQVQDTEGQF